MNLEELLFGTGSILRERVSGLATEPGQTANVYPDHPPLDLSPEVYPRATVDTISNSSLYTGLQKGSTVGSLLVDVTVYAVNSREMNQILGDSLSAIQEYWDDTDSNGDPYFETWEFEDFGNVGPVFEEESSRGYTRYNKTAEVEFSYTSGTSSNDGATIGGVEIASIVDIESNTVVPSDQTKDVSEIAPTITTHQPDVEQLDMTFLLSETFHSQGDSLEQQKKDVDSLKDTEPHENRFDFLTWDGWLGITGVDYFREQEGYMEGTISAYYLPYDDYIGHDNFS